MAAPQPPMFIEDPGHRRVLVALAFLVAFIALDWASYIRPMQGLNITPWNPQPALAIALLMWNPRLIWLVWLGLVAADLVVRGVPAHVVPPLTVTIALTLIYAAMARTLKVRVGTIAPFRVPVHLLWLAATATVGSLIGSVVYVVGYASSLGSAETLAVTAAMGRYWVGDAVGLIVTLPIVLSIGDRARRAALASTLKNPEWWASTAFAGACLLLIFSTESGYFRYFYLLLLPVVWASARFGLPGAVLSSAAAQMGLIAAAQVALQYDLTLFQLQLLMAALTLTGLLVGVLVDERAQAGIELRNSLRFAAAGQMAAALAHELMQPLTAVSNYAAACRVLANEGELDPQRRAQLTGTLQNLSAEAQRAGSVIRRLRDFFRSGATSLERINPARTFAEGVATQQVYANRLGIQLSSDMPARLPEVWLDPVQIAVVVRNLVANAIESAASAEVRQVHVRAHAARSGVVLEVHDSGPGIDLVRLQTLFESAPSSKAGGLGVGLSICRAIIEAHGGKLWAEPGTGGHFFLTLPTDDHVPDAIDTSA